MSRTLNPGIGTPHGEYHGAAKLTEQKVRWLRRVLAKRQATTYELAETLGVSPSNVSMAARGITWSHVPGALRQLRATPKLFDPRTMPIGRRGHDTSGRAKPRPRKRAERAA